MTLGVGGKTEQQALALLHDMMAGAVPIALPEYRQRLCKAQEKMRALGVDVLYLPAGTNLRYFTGTQWSPSERVVAALLFADGEMEYIVPQFERGSFSAFCGLRGAIHSWHEHESPYELIAQRVRARFAQGVDITLALSECTPFFVFDGLRKVLTSARFINATTITAACRMQKSAPELALMQTAKNMTLAVHKAAASILREGISTEDVSDFIHRAHQRVGAGGSYFCIVLFGEATQYPHGVKDPQHLKNNDMVLIDTGCKVHGYISDITRTYVFGQASPRQRQIWQAEKHAQAAAFAAAQIGQPCGAVDRAARAELARHGLSANYDLPGLPHRTGHGIGLDIHEWPYLVTSDDTPLAPGMCFSNEPMICVPGEFGIRLEDHFYMTEDGPKWFTEPSFSIDDPFGLQAQQA